MDSWALLEGESSEASRAATSIAVAICSAFLRYMLSSTVCIERCCGSHTQGDCEEHLANDCRTHNGGQHREVPQCTARLTLRFAGSACGTDSVP